MHLLSASFLSLLLTLPAPTMEPPDPDPSDLEGHWAGIIETPAGDLELALQLEHGDDSWKGAVTAPGMMAEDRALEEIEVAEGVLRASIDHRGTMWMRGAELHLEPLPEEDGLVGEIYQANSGAGHENVVDRVRLAPRSSARAAALREQVVACPEPTDDPFRAHLETSDIESFWKAVDASDGAFREEAFREHYFGSASRGLLDFRNLRLGGVDDFVEALNERRAYYRWMADHRDQIHDRLEEVRERVRAHFLAVQSLYPEATFPPVYFVVGEMNSGGTVSPCGLLIGTEMRARDGDTPVHELSDWERDHTGDMETVPALITHELIHSLQDNAPRETLLDHAIHEGSADFVAHLATGVRSVDPERDAWADAREEELWERFRRDRDAVLEPGRDNAFRDWMYGEPSEDDWPSDLGYWTGYRITQAYFEAREDPYEAIREILSIEDFQAFLEESGYPDF